MEKNYETYTALDMFTYTLPKFKFNEKIRLFEAFSGIGTQAMALKRITKNYELVGFSEIDRHAIQSYRAIHGDINNYGDITKMETIPNCDLFTWSFPCTDLSKSGKQQGLENTRSGLAFEIIRLLTNTVNNGGELPKVLVMENVPDLLCEKFKDGWNEIYSKIENLGYSNYVDVLNAKDYGVPHGRNRVFMISIYGKYSFSFPGASKLAVTVKDFLEDYVNEKYYLTNKQIEQILSWNSQRNPLKEMVDINSQYIPTLTAKSNTSMNASMLLFKEPTIIDLKSTKSFKRKPSSDYVPTILTDSRFCVSIGSRVRKLTPLECWRFMGISDSDYIKVQQSGVSDTQLYRQAGNAIVVDVLEAIFKEMMS